jgi:hypothetical protein
LVTAHNVVAAGSDDKLQKIRARPNRRLYLWRDRRLKCCRGTHGSPRRMTPLTVYICAAGCLAIQGRFRAIVPTCWPACDGVIHRPYMCFFKKTASRPIQPGGLPNCQFKAGQSSTSSGSFATARWQFATAPAPSRATVGRLAANAFRALAGWSALAVVATGTRTSEWFAAGAVPAIAIRSALAIIAARARTCRFGATGARLALAIGRAQAVLATTASAVFRSALAQLAGANRLATTVGRRLLGRKPWHKEQSQKHQFRQHVILSIEITIRSNTSEANDGSRSTAVRTLDLDRINSATRTVGTGDFFRGRFPRQTPRRKVAAESARHEREFDDLPPVRLGANRVERAERARAAAWFAAHRNSRRNFRNRWAAQIAPALLPGRSNCRLVHASGRRTGRNSPSPCSGSRQGAKKSAALWQRPSTPQSRQCTLLRLTYCLFCQTKVTYIILHAGADVSSPLRWQPPARLAFSRVWEVSHLVFG